MSENVVNGHRIDVSSRALLRSALLDPLLANATMVFSLTVMFTVSDAFETEALGQLHSIALWVVVSLLMVLQTGLSHRFFMSFFSGTQLSRLLAAGLALLATVLLMTAELHFLKFTPLLPKNPDPFMEFLVFVAQPVLAAGSLTLLSQSNAIQQYVDFMQRSDVNQALGCEKLDELTAILRQKEILRVSAQDHYLEIDCIGASYLIRGRMRDALAVLEQREGVQVHRSHWVARRHVLRVRRNGRDARLVLSDGAEVPVARSRLRLISKIDPRAV